MSLSRFVESLKSLVAGMPSVLVGYAAVMLIVPWWSLAFLPSPIQMVSNLQSWQDAVVLAAFWILPFLQIVLILTRSFLFVPAFVIECVALVIATATAKKDQGMALQLVQYVSLAALLVSSLVLLNKDLYFPLLAKVARLWRKGSRASFNGMLSLDVDGKAIPLVMEDCSTGGMGVSGEYGAITEAIGTYPKGTAVTVKMAARGGWQPVKGVVCWHQDVGPIRRLGIQIEDQGELAKYVGIVSGYQGGEAKSGKVAAFWVTSSAKRAMLAMWAASMAGTYMTPACGTQPGGSNLDAIISDSGLGFGLLPVRQMYDGKVDEGDAFLVNALRLTYAPVFCDSGDAASTFAKLEDMSRQQPGVIRHLDRKLYVKNKGKWAKVKGCKISGKHLLGAAAFAGILTQSDGDEVAQTLWLAARGRSNVNGEAFANDFFFFLDEQIGIDVALASPDTFKRLDKRYNPCVGGGSDGKIGAFACDKRTGHYRVSGSDAKFRKIMDALIARINDESAEYLRLFKRHAASDEYKGTLVSLRPDAAISDRKASGGGFGLTSETGEAPPAGGGNRPTAQAQTLQGMGLLGRMRGQLGIQVVGIPRVPLVMSSGHTLEALTMDLADSSAGFEQAEDQEVSGFGLAGTARGAQPTFTNVPGRPNVSARNYTTPSGTVVREVATATPRPGGGWNYSYQTYLPKYGANGRTFREVQRSDKPGAFTEQREGPGSDGPAEYGASNHFNGYPVHGRDPGTPGDWKAESEPVKYMENGKQRQLVMREYPDGSKKYFVLNEKGDAYVPTAKLPAAFSPTGPGSNQVVNGPILEQQYAEASERGQRDTHEAVLRGSNVPTAAELGQRFPDFKPNESGHQIVTDPKTGNKYVVANLWPGSKEPASIIKYDPNKSEFENRQASDAIVDAQKKARAEGGVAKPVNDLAVDDDTAGPDVTLTSARAASAASGIAADVNAAASAEGGGEPMSYAEIAARAGNAASGVASNGGDEEVPGADGVLAGGSVGPNSTILSNEWRVAGDAYQNPGQDQGQQETANPISTVGDSGGDNGWFYSTPGGAGPLPSGGESTDTGWNSTSTGFLEQQTNEYTDYAAISDTHQTDSELAAAIGEEPGAAVEQTPAGETFQSNTDNVGEEPTGESQ